MTITRQSKPFHCTKCKWRIIVILPIFIQKTLNFTPWGDHIKCYPLWFGNYFWITMTTLMANVMFGPFGMIKGFKLASYCHISHIYTKDRNFTPCGDHIKSYPTEFGNYWTPWGDHIKSYPLVVSNYFWTIMIILYVKCCFLTIVYDWRVKSCKLLSHYPYLY